MQIKIPEKYFKRYSATNKVYLSYWKNNSIWIMFDYEKYVILDQLGNLNFKDKKQMLNFVNLGMVETQIVENYIEIPKSLLDYIGSKEPRLIIEEERLILCK